MKKKYIWFIVVFFISNQATLKYGKAGDSLLWNH